MVSLRFLLSLIIILSLPLSTNALFQANDIAPKTQSAPTRLILKFQSDIKVNFGNEKSGRLVSGLSAVDALNDKHGARKAESAFPEKASRKLPDPLKNVFVITYESSKDASSFAAEYANLPNIEYAEPDYEYYLDEVPDDPLYAHQWFLNNTGQGFYHVERNVGPDNDSLIIFYGTTDADIDAHEVYQTPPDNTETVVVAILDTGVDLGHPDLQGRFFINIDEIPNNNIDDDFNGYVDDTIGWNYFDGLNFLDIYESNDPTDTHGHGTHCAGIVSAYTGNGVGVAGIAADCKIMPLRLGNSILVSKIAKALVYAADNGADVISMSLGGTAPSDLLNQSIQYAYSKGLIICASSGNDGAEKFKFPACYTNVLAIGASNALDEVTDFSTYNSFISVCAPGQSILSLRASGTDMYGTSNEWFVHIIEDQYYLASGTSMSCPCAAGSLAGLLSVSPGLTQDAAIAILESSADDIIDPYGDGSNYPGYDIYSGHGRVNYNNMIINAPDVRAIIETPENQSIYSGTVDIYGYADGADFTDYILEFGEGENPETWTEIYTSSSPVENGNLASWNTSGLSGVYSLRLRVGLYNESKKVVYISDGATTVAEIDSPLDGDTLIASMAAPIIGTAICPDFSHYLLQYGSGLSPTEWDTIAVSNVPLIDEGELGLWNSSIVLADDYTLQLIVYSDIGEEASASLAVTVESPFSGENGWTAHLGADIGGVPTYGDFDGDGINEILVGDSVGIHFYDLSGALKTEGMPSAPNYDFRMPIAVGNLDNDGIDDIAAVGSYSDGDAGKLFGFLSTGADFEIELPLAPVISYIQSGTVGAAPAVLLKDVDFDGIDEIHYYNGYVATSSCDSICTGTPAKCYIYNSDGQLRFDVPTDGDFRNYYFSADIDKDGMDEIYRSSDYLYKYDLQGVLLDSFDLTMGLYEVAFGSRITAADIDRNGQYELVIMAAAGDLDGCGGLRDGEYIVYVFDENLDLLPGWPIRTFVGSFVIPHAPIFCDINNDRDLEFFITYYNISASSILAWNYDGTPFLGNDFGLFGSIPLPGKIYNPVMADIDGDMETDIISCFEPDVYHTSHYEGLMAWDNEGAELPNWPLITATDQSLLSNTSHVRFYPVAGDFNKDGNIDLMRTTTGNKLVFTTFSDVSYDETANVVPFYNLNRKLNNISPSLAICVDSDGDGYGDPGMAENECPEDNCPDTFNPDQSDLDNDGFGDACDDCTDPDADGYGNPGLSAAECPDDNCSWVYNPDQIDTDTDGVGDACDNCVNDPNPEQADDDEDGIGDVCDACVDTDGDGFGDPGYPANTCAEDNCPDIYNPDQADSDSDGLADSCDNCALVYNLDQADLDGDGFGDACDECTDTDGDGFGNPGFIANSCEIDNCPLVPNVSQEDTDTDAVGDSCDNCIDIPNTDQADNDLDEVGNICDNCPDDENWSQWDEDSDGFGTPCDNCPHDYNPDQTDDDGNGLGDICEFICGDINSDASVNILDIIYIIRYLYSGGPPPEALGSADVDGSGSLNVLDITYLIDYLYRDGSDLNCGNI